MDVSVDRHCDLVERVVEERYERYELLKDPMENSNMRNMYQFWFSF